MTRPSVVSLVIGLLGLVAAAVMGVVLITDDSGDLGATEEGFVIEPASNVGPDAFTPSVEVDDEAICDKERLLAELASRPDALREWARVLGLAESQVPAYVSTLTARVLDEDTMVTNHGLRDGTAYARPAVLEAGTAVLVDLNADNLGETQLVPPDLGGGPDLPDPVVPPEELTTGSVPETVESVPSTTASSTTVPGGGTPITRCRCGNPLLPPYAAAGGETATTTTSTPEEVDPPEVAPPPEEIPPEEIPPEDIPSDSGPTEDVVKPDDSEPDDDGPPGDDSPD